MFGLNKYLLIGSLGLSLTLALAVTVMQGQRDRAKAEAAHWRSEAVSANAALVQVQEAEAAFRGHLERMEAEAERWAEINAKHKTLEGADEPLSSYLRAVFDSVRR